MTIDTIVSNRAIDRRKQQGSSLMLDQIREECGDNTVETRGNQVYDLQELKDELVCCFCEAKRALSRKTVYLKEAKGLFGYLGKIRSLLLKVHRIQNSSLSPDRPDAMRQLQEIFLELEGIERERKDQPESDQNEFLIDKKSA